MAKQKQIRVYVGFSAGKPDLYCFSDYYDGVRHGDWFKTKREARQCYEDVRKATLIVEESERRR